MKHPLFSRFQSTARRGSSRRPGGGRSRFPLVVVLLAAGWLGSAEAQETNRPVFVGPLVTPIKVTVRPKAPSQTTPVSPAEPATVPEGEPLPTVPPPPRRPIADPTFQGTPGNARKSTGPGEAVENDAVSAPIVNVAGISSASNPPDVTGDVGPNHFIQMVNATRFQIFNKSGTPLTAALLFGDLWTPAKGNAGDPIVVYDHLADRWVLTQFFSTGMYFAISQTSDPTAGTWFLYEFTTGTGIPDYPKIGVWPDAYYMSSYESPSLGIYAFDRAKMLAGLPANLVKTTIPVLTPQAGVRDTRILPVDLDGPAPAPGTPGYFVRTVDDRQDVANPTDRIEIYEAIVNWAAPSLTFNLVNNLIPAAFDTMACNRNGSGIRDCIPQPNTTATVDALSNRPMMQLKYRNFGTYAAMVFNQAIDVSGSIPGLLGFTPSNDVSGLRWYQLIKSNANWVIGQQGTFSPQPPGATNEAQLLHRWMGSAAMNGRGDIAIGYSIVNDDDSNPVFPGIRYTGRLATDPPNTMPQGEGIILNGVNSKGANGSFGNRWGDYSQMGVDPTDDCTFWFTTHDANGATRIASFTLGVSCAAPTIAGAPSALVAESCPPGNGAVDPGETVTVSLVLTNAGFVNATNITATLLPTGGVTSPSGPQVYGAMPTNGPAVSNNFTFTADGPCGGTVTATLQLTEGAVNIGTVAFVFTLGNSNVCCLDPAAADVGLTITAAPEPVLVGSNLTYTITVTNNGPALATGVNVTNNPPATASFVSAVTSQGTVGTNASGRVVASLGALASGATATVTVVVTPTVVGNLTATANVVASQFDYNSFNNSASAASTASIPTITINDVSVTEGNAGTANAVFTVTLTPAFGQTVTVNFATANGTALAGLDYLATNGVLTFPPGVTNQTVTVLVIGETLSETNETYFLNLSSPGNAVLGDAQGLGTIVDDDPLPTFQYATNFAVVEGNAGTTNVTIALSLSAVSGRNISVFFTTANSTATAGSDYVSRSGTATFPPGTTTSNLVFTVNGDTLVENNELFFVNFSSAVNATLTNTQARITITNDDGLPGNLDHFAWSAIGSPQTVNEPFLVTVTALDATNALATNYAGPALLSGVNGTGNEYFRINFESGLAGFTISNNFGRSNGLWHLSTGRATNAGHTASNSLYYGTNETLAGGGSYNTGTNEGVAISPLINLSNAPSPLTLSFNHLLGRESSTSFDQALVEISTNNGAAYTVLAGTTGVGTPIAGTGGLWVPVNIDLSTYAGSQIRLRFHFNTVDSAANNFEGWYVDDIAITATLPPVPIIPTVTGAFTNGVWAGLVSVQQGITNMSLRAGDANGHTNDSGTFAVNASPYSLAINNATQLEIAGLLNFTVTLSPTNAQTVTVAYSTADGTATAGSDYLAASGVVTFLPGQTNQSVTVAVIDDPTPELNETFYVVLGAATNAAVVAGGGRGTILNDDAALPVTNEPRNDFWMPNASVNAVLETNGVIYLGGNFTEMGGTNLGRFAPFDPATGDVLPGFPLVDRAVNAVVSDGSGGWYIGGDFLNVGGVPRFRLAHILANRTVDTNFTANCSSTVSALLVNGTNLLVGGLFTSITNGVTGYNRARFAALDPATGAPRVLASDPQFNGTVTALAANGNTAYVGGAFTAMTNGVTVTSRFRLAAIDLTTGQPTAWVADADNAVNVLALGSNAVYAAGTFTGITNGSLQQRFRFAALDLATGAPIAPFTDFNSTVQSLLVDGARIYVGGFFFTVTNGATSSLRTNLVAIDSTTGAVLPWQPAANGAVRAMAVNGANLVVGGDFTSIGGQSDRRRLAAVSLATGLATAFDPDVGSTVNALAADATQVYAGGTFNFARGTIRNRVAAVDAVTGALLPWNPNATSTVQALAAAGTNIYLGGFFTSVNGIVRNRVAAVDPASGAVNLAFSNSFPSTVRALVLGGTNLYVGGEFTNVTSGSGTLLKLGLAAVNPSNGAVRAGFTANLAPLPSITNGVFALAYGDGTLYAGGTFTNIGGQLRLRIAALDGATGAPTAWNPNCSGAVNALFADGNIVFAAGAFTTITNNATSFSRTRLAALDVATGAPAGWNPAPISTVSALAVRGTNIIAGGAFTSVGGQARNFLAGLDATLAVNAPEAWNPNLQNTVNAVAASANRILAGGTFTAVGAQARPFFAVFQPDVAPLITTTAGAATFTENGPPTPVDAALTLTDGDSATMVSATVRVATNLVAGEDVLEFTPANGISGFFHPPSGTLILSGASAVSNYQAALRSVTYRNTSDVPSTLPRAIEFVANDAILTSAPKFRTVGVVAVNESPAISALPSVTTVENWSTAAIPFVISDEESSPTNLFLAALPANPILAPTANITFGGSGSNRTVRVLPGTNQSGATTITIFLSDGTNMVSTPFSLTVLADTDHDGIPDVFENANGMNPNDPADAALDFDGDGMTNLQEYLAGTNPNDSYNYLRVIFVAVAGADTQITFTSIAGKTYRVEKSDDVAGGVWTLVVDNVPGTGGNVISTDAGGASQPQRVYRVRLLP